MPHDVLTNLTPDGDSGDHTATIAYESRQIKIRIVPDDQVLETTLTLTINLIGRLHELDKSAKQVAVRDLRDTYNDGWNEYDEAQDDGTYKSVTNPTLSAQEFEEKLSLNAINVTGEKMVTFFYDDENMFWGHSVVVTSLHGADFSRARAELFG
jgi:hypothetical protein